MTRAARFARSATIKLSLGASGAATPAYWAVLAATLLVAVAVMLALAPWPAWVRGPLALAFVVMGEASQRILARRRTPARGWLVIDDDGVRRAGPGAETSTLIDWREPFGATILSSADRATFVVALTTRRSTRYVSATASADDAETAPTLVERATTVAESDLGPEEAMLTAVDAETLLCAIARRSPCAFDRLYLTSAAGEAVALENGQLSVGPRKVDLTAPLEWCATVFQERGVHAASVCQATWVRQGEAEFVLVAPLAADGAWLGEGDAFARAARAGNAVRRAAARDLGLMQATVADPPPRELRCAIDRVFMLPLRRLLDHAPRFELREPRRRTPRASHP